MTETTIAYNERCLVDGDLRDSMARIPLPPAFDACWGQRLLPRPLFVGGQEMTVTAEEVMRVFDLLASLPQRLFDGNVRRYCNALGFDRSRAELVGRFMTSAPARYGRADLYHDGTRFKLLEFNVAADVGGTQMGQLARSLLSWTPFREFARDREITYTDTSSHIASTLRTAADPLATRDSPEVLILCGPGGIKKDRLILAGLVETLNAYSLRARFAEPDAIRYQAGRVTVDGTRIDVVLRYFNLDDIVGDPEEVAWAWPLLRAHENGRVIIWTGLDNAAYSHKMTLVLLSDPRWRPAFSAQEITLLDRLLPVTRILRDANSIVDGEEVNLLDYARTERSNLILKPVRGWGGHGIVPGWEHSDREWRTLISDCADGNHLIQRRVVPRREPVVNPQTRAIENWTAVYGLFVTPVGYAGAFGRALPVDGGAVVNYSSNAQTRVTAVFTSDAILRGFPSPTGRRRSGRLPRCGGRCCQSRTRRASAELPGMVLVSAGWTTLSARSSVSSATS